MSMTKHDNTKYWYMHAVSHQNSSYIPYNTEKIVCFVMSGQSYGEPVSWMDSTEEEIVVWTSMIENPNHWIDTSLPIRTNLAQWFE